MMEFDFLLMLDITFRNLIELGGSPRPYNQLFSIFNYLQKNAYTDCLSISHALRSLTKFYALPGLRIGYAISNPDRLKKWQSWRDPWSVNVLAQEAAIACLKDIEFQQKTWDWLPDMRSHLFDRLTKIAGLTPQPSAANFLLVKSKISSIKLRDHLLINNRILIRDCLSFAELGESFFRVCVGTLETQTKLLEALETTPF
jgi:histidinol-phosphate/aromatic aminotransferase/cobyric acid decarboxylase-like protein